MATRKLQPPAGRRIIELPNAQQGAPTSGTLVRINPPATRRTTTEGGMDFEVPGAPKEDGGGFSFTRGALSILGDIIPGPVGKELKAPAEWVGANIKYLPVFGAKLLQTAAGATELLSPVGQARVATGRSRIQEDWRKGQEQGLEGDALLFYSLQRQLPFVASIGEEATYMGRTLAELATAGRYDYGDNGIDYARAWERGELTPMILDQLGLVILAGRGAGLGNVMARGGQAVARAGAPRLGQAISTTGRFAEEPIGTLGRGTARLVAPAAQRAGMPRTAAAAGRIAAATPDTTAGVGPFRQTVTEITGAARRRASRRWEQLQVEINGLADERNNLVAFDPNNPRIGEINAQIGQLEKRQDNALIRAGYPKDVRAQIRQGQQNYEAYRTSFQETSAQFAKAGIEPRSRELLEAEAGRKRAEAARLREQGQTARADELDKQADQAILFAELNDQYPGVLNGPLRSEVSPAAHILLNKEEAFVLEMVQQGMDAQQIANLLTSPRIAPDIQYRGYRFSAADVQYLIDYLNGTLNPAQAVALVAVYNHYKNWSDWFTAEQIRGRGRKEPLSYVALQFTPDPKKLLEFIDRYGKNGQELMRVLDETLALIAEQTSPGILDEFNFDPDSPTGVFKAFAETDYGSIPFNLANAAIIVRYAELATNPQFTQIFRSPDIYPPNMRRLMEAEERFMAGTRAEAVQSMLDDLKLIAEDFADFLDQRTLDAIAARIAKLENTPAAFDRVQFNRLADAVGRMAARALKRLEAAAQATDILTQQQQAIIADIEFGYSTLNSLEAYLRNLAEGDPAMSPRLRTAEANQQALADEKAALEAEKAQLDEQFAAQREEQKPRLQGIDTELETIGARLKELDEQDAKIDRDIARHTYETEALREALRLYPEYADSEKALQIADDYQLMLDAGLGEAQPVRVTQKRVKEAKEQAIRDAEVEADLDQKFAIFSALMADSSSPLQRTAKTFPDGRKSQPGVADEEYLNFISRYLPNTPEQPWVDEFIDTFTSEDGRALDVVAEAANETYFGEISSSTSGMAAREFTSIETWLEEISRAFRDIKEGEALIEAARKKPLKQYREDLESGQGALFAGEQDFSRYSQTGLPDDVIREIFFILSRGEDQATARLAEIDEKYDIVAKRQQSQKNQTERRNIQVRQTELRDQRIIDYDRPASIRSSQIQRRLRQIRRQEAPKRRAVEFARKAEPAEAAKAERAALRGVGRVFRPEPGAEGPRGAQILRGVRTAAEKRLARLEGEETAKTAVISRLKTEQQRLSALESQARSSRDAAVNAVETQQRQPFGPLRTGLSGRTTYMPGGMTQNVRNARNIATEMRSDGAAPQLKTQAELSRFTAIQPLSLEETAIKIGELTNAFNRHVIVEEILTDPNMTKNPVSLLGVERIDAIRTKAEQRVMEQTRTQTQEGLTRSQQDIDAAVRQEFGRLLTEEINRAGYEPVSRVDVDPETGQHEAVGNLLDKVAPEDVNESTFLMRRGMAERIVQEFVSKAATNIPDRVANLAQSVGNLTGAWKTMVLPFSLRWQIGDLAGNVMNAWMIGDIPPNVLVARMIEVNQRLGIDRKNVLDAADIAYDGLVKVLQDAGLQARGVKLSSIAALRSPEANPATAINDLNMMFGPLQQLRRNAFKFNEYQNLVARTAFAIEKLNQILTEQGRSIEEVTPQSLYNDPVLTKAIQDAVAETHKALGAFSEMSPWERRVVRQVYPFWAWVRFINKAAANLVIDNPDRVLFTLALGSMVSEPDDTGYFSFLQGTIPISGIYTNLEFLVPYQDAIIFGENPVARLQETVTGLSPVIRTPMRAAGLLTQYATGWQTWPFDSVSQPSYLEGRPGQSRRDVGILAGELAYLFLKDWGGPLRTSLEWLPSDIPGLTQQGRIIGTDVAVGPGPRFAQGSLRTTGRYAEPRLSGTQQRLSAIMRALGVPGAPIADVEAIRQQAQQGRLLDERARLRKQQEMLRSRLG